MVTRFIKDLEDMDRDKKIKEAGDIIKKGGLVGFPTETVYGLGGNALDKEAAKRIYEAKGRPSNNPLIIHIYRMEDLEHIVSAVSEKAIALAKAFWPGPLTIILPKHERVPLETTGGLSTVAVRMPSHQVALDFIKEAGGFVAAPSANTSGRPSPTIAEHVYEDLNGKIEMVLDGGLVGIGIESTIVDLTEDIPVILRPGYITEEMLTEVLGKVETDPTILSMSGMDKPKAPGMMYKHYAPQGALSIVTGENEKVISYINAKIHENNQKSLKTGVICTDETKNQYVDSVIKTAGSREDQASIARNLYKILREFDEEKVDIIYSESFSCDKMGQAIMNRLLKAAGHDLIEV